MDIEIRRITIRVSPKTHQELKAICKKYHENQSQVIKRLITEKYTKEGLE